MAYKVKSTHEPDVVRSGNVSRTYNSSGVLLQTFNHPDFPVGIHQSSIVYTNKPPGTWNSRTGSNSCVHKRYSMTYAGNPAQMVVRNFIPSPASGYIEDMGHHVIPCNHRVTVANMMKNDLFPNGTFFTHMQAHMDDAFLRLKPDLTTFSLPTFVFELREVKKLYQFWNRNVSLVKNLAGQHLNWSFGWKPFLGDLHKLVGIVVPVIQKLEEWNRLAKSNDLFQRSCVLESSSNSVSGTYLNIPSAGSNMEYNGTVTWKVEAFLTFKALPIPGIDTLTTRLRAYMDVFGIEANPKILWDAIPFSFVVDWFLDVGGYLNSFRYDTLALPVVLVDSCLQYKEEYHLEHRYVHTNGVYVGGRTSGWVRQHEVNFHRVLRKPSSNPVKSTGWSFLKFGQAGLLVSLLTTLKK